MTTYPKCPECGGTVVPRPVLSLTKAPPNTDMICLRCDTAFQIDGQRLIKIGTDLVHKTPQ